MFFFRIFLKNSIFLPFWHSFSLRHLNKPPPPPPWKTMGCDVNKGALTFIREPKLLIPVSMWCEAMMLVQLFFNISLYNSLKSHCGSWFITTETLPIHHNRYWFIAMTSSTRFTRSQLSFNASKLQSLRSPSSLWLTSTQAVIELCFGSSPPPLEVWFADTNTLGALLYNLIKDIS